MTYLETPTDTTPTDDQPVDQSDGKPDQTNSVDHDYIDPLNT